MLNIVLFGGPGSGKGTQSARLIDRYGLYHISTGEVLRDHIARGTQLGKVADSFISKGNLIPDELMIDILDSELDRPEAVNGVIFDGFPRTIPQAEALEKLLAKRSGKVDAVVGLEVPEEELTARLINRGKESGRIDDNSEVIKKRLEVYHRQTEPLKAHYIGKDLYLPVEGTGTVEDIFHRIAANIESKTDATPRKRG